MFKELEDLRKEYDLVEISDEQLAKYEGLCVPGCHVEIHWDGGESDGHKFDDIVDHGYVFVVDGMDAESGDAFVHIPEPDNSGGKDRAHDEWTYVNFLLVNERCKKVIFYPI